MSRTVVSGRLGSCLGALALLSGGAAPSLVRAAPPAAPAPLDLALHQIYDHRYGGVAADPAPLQPTSVQLRSAEVHLAEIPIKDGWQVAATYELYQPGAAPAALPVLLAERRCSPGATCSALAGAFQELGVRFAGRLIEPAAAPPEVVQRWADPPGQGHLYQLSVPPERPAELSVEYLLDRSSGGSFFGVQVRSAAGLFQGPIAHLRYVVELKQPTPYVIYPRAFKLAEFSEQPNERGAGSLTRLVFTAAGVRGRGDGDLVAIFPGDALAGATPAGYCAGFRGDQTDKELAQTLAGYSGELLRACRELVLALHGAPLQEPAARARYYGTPPRLPAWADKKLFALAPRPQAAAFHQTLLGPGERSYLRAVEAAALRRRN